jgi:hypothetical protein
LGPKGQAHGAWGSRPCSNNRLEIGRLKRHLGIAVYQPDREAWILERAEANNPGPLDSGAVRRVFERVIDESRRLERLAQEAEARGASEAPDAPPPEREGDQV